MPKDEWGVKRICPTCSTRFYDLRTRPDDLPELRRDLHAREPDRGQGQGAAAREGQARAGGHRGPARHRGRRRRIEADDDLDDEILEDEEDNVDLEEIADVASDEEES